MINTGLCFRVSSLESLVWVLAQNICKEIYTINPKLKTINPKLKTLNFYALRFALYVFIVSQITKNPAVRRGLWLSHKDGQGKVTN